MPYDDVLVHRATPVAAMQVTDGEDEYIEGEPDEDWIEGEPDVDEVPGTPFDCCLFLPQGTEQAAPRGRRTITRPTLLLAAEDDEGLPVLAAAELLLDIVAEELTGPTPVRWQVDGDPQPFGKPGTSIIGSQVALKRVRD